MFDDDICVPNVGNTANVGPKADVGIGEFFEQRPAFPKSFEHFGDTALGHMLDEVAEKLQDAGGGLQRNRTARFVQAAAHPLTKKLNFEILRKYRKILLNKTSLSARKRIRVTREPINRLAKIFGFSY